MGYGERRTRDTGHDAREGDGKLLGLGHRLVDGENESDPLEGKDGGSVGPVKQVR